MAVSALPVGRNDGGTSGGSVRLMGEAVYEMWFSGANRRRW